MSTEELTALKDRLAALTPQEKLELATFLRKQAESSSALTETKTDGST